MATHGSFVNPYKWNFDFLKEYGPGITYFEPGGVSTLKRNQQGLKILIKKWSLTSGSVDPLLTTGQASIVQGNLQTKKSQWGLLNENNMQLVDLSFTISSCEQ